jgi:hypothetical protein
MIIMKNSTNTYGTVATSNNYVSVLKKKTGLWTIVPSYPWEQTARPPGKAGHYRQS